MTVRLFRCDECGHRMRLGRNYCGRCFAAKPVAQRPAMMSLFAIVVAALAALAVVRFV
ncbi:hypothetical protein [Citreimonas salinaria]|uniref:hypothetical protein n=1 Tax=Citreimonas salinaria TaxID=321339 RepID=UPI0015A6F89B|nr:hypothetical protein [Citreimonas salinaria]